MAFGEVVDKGLDVCRDGLVAPSTVAFLHPAVTFLPEWAMHLGAAILFVVLLALLRDYKQHCVQVRAHKAEREAERQRLRHIPAPKVRQRPRTA